MPYCKVSHANIYYEDIGEGKPIVMIHGYSLDHRLMSACMEPIIKDRAGWRRIYIDLPGMGQTKDYEKINNSDDMLNAVITLIETLIPNQTFLIAGESYGGYLARGIIKELKDRILGAAFICPMIIPSHEDRDLPNHAIITSDKEFLTRLTEEELLNFRANHVVLDEYNWDRYSKEILAGSKLSDPMFLAKVQQGYGFSFSLEGVGCDKPSIFLLGKQDSVVGYKDAFELLDHFPRATFAVLNRAGHNLQIEQAGLFHSHISEWIDRVEEFK
ncbi:alpha/beta fold hydrolase [Cytobacillus purgationiresistens]|uniref:Pimeloyl-ACP methyl ester carboxylesterase n=1 Tax=Cytobacillus purgationiresistens TaxID=863449 RepID=A0ABU0ACU0_9BACI|nr:alpha/beta hydrolase [Cytobacillus purgationiresistens]MDQ0268248.1 pimeloyl-ACP methyl ester carboxylesterase [Cytobacillus purgationiresistens]